MGGSSKAKVQVTDYYLSLHYGVCHGPVDGILQLQIGEKEVWSAESALIESGLSESELDESYLFTPAYAVVDKRDLLGGNMKEGGYGGLVDLLNGGGTQTIDTNHRQAMSPDAPDRVPGFRGIFSMIFYGGGSDRHTKGGGFYWGSNTGYIRDVWVKVFRSPKGFYPEKATIPRPGSKEPDANPAHIIYECLTNNDWGLQGNPSMIDRDSFKRCADTLHTEKFGLSMMWNGQATIESFVDEVLRHIDATLAVNPRTGLLRLRLVRNDYVASALPEINPDNARLKNFSRRAWGETINEITVAWTNPVNEGDETVTFHELGNILQQGSIISETRNYYGVRTAALAMRLAQRDALSASAPLAAIEVEVDRTAWDWMPGEVVRFTWPPLDIYDLVVRIGTMDYGSTGKPYITVTAVEDAFNLPGVGYTSPPSSEWRDPSAPPSPMTHVNLTTAPFFMVADEMGDAEAALVPDTLAYNMVLAAHENSDAFSFTLYDPATDLAGNPSWRSLGTKSPTGLTELVQPLAKEPVSTIVGFLDPLGSLQPETGTLVWIGTDDLDHELALIESYTESGQPVLRRGVLDTVPKAWSADTPVWFWNSTAAVDDPEARAPGQTVTYKLLTTTSQGTLALADAPEVTHTATDRMHRPYRPANVRIWDTLWPGVVAGYAPAVTVSWSPRNRLWEIAKIMGWEEGPVASEPGTTFTVRLLDGDETGPVVQEITGITESQVDIDLTGLTGPTGTVAVWAVRDGLESFQADHHTFTVAGYGMNHGNYYGGYYG